MTTPRHIRVGRAGGHWLERERLPVPRWWPAGVGYEPMQGDPDTGAYSVMLRVPGAPILGRWPSGGELPRHWPERTADRQLHKWCNDGWQWALAVDDPLPVDELARVVASIRPGGAPADKRPG